MASGGQDASFLDQLIAIAQHYLPEGFLVLLAGFMWRGSARVTKFESEQDEHRRRLDEHAAEIATLKIEGAASRVIIAGLPTRDDIRDLRDEARAQTSAIQAQIQSGFENVSRMITRKE